MGAIQNGELQIDFLREDDDGAYGPMNWISAGLASFHLDDLDADDYAQLRAHFLEYGAWDEEEVSAWSEYDLRALVIQDATAILWEDHMPGVTEDEKNGTVYEGDDGHLYYYVGS